MSNIPVIVKVIMDLVGDRIVRATSTFFTPLDLKCRVTVYQVSLFIMRQLLTKEAMNVA